MEIDPLLTDLTSENSNYQNVDDGGVMLVEGSKDEREHVRTTQQTTLRGRTVDCLHTLKGESGKRRRTQLTCQMMSCLYSGQSSKHHSLQTLLRSLRTGGKPPSPT